MIATRWMMIRAEKERICVSFYTAAANTAHKPKV